jgi:hypothetical protein
MNPEDQPTDDAAQGAPSVSSDAEYDAAVARMRGDRQKEVELQTPEPQDHSAGKRVSSWFSNLVPDSNTLPKYGKAIARGVVNAGREAANTLNSIKDSSDKFALDLHDKMFGHNDEPFVEHWYNTPILDSTPMTDGEVEGMLGKREEGMAGFVESVAQFSTGMLVAGEVLKPLQVLSKANTLRTALAGGIADMTVFDPHQARLSDMVQNSQYGNVITGLLANDKNDSELVARLKAGTEGLITGYTLDKFIGGVKALRALKGAKTEAEKAAALEHLNVPNNVEKNGPAIVKQTESGTFQVTEAQPVERRVSARRVNGPGRRSTDPQVYGEGATAARKADAGEIEFYQNRNTTYDEFRQQHPHITTTKAEWDAVAEDIAKRPAPLEFANASDAEAVAASTNQAVLNRRPPLSIHLLTDEQVTALKEAGDALLKQTGWDPTDFNFNYVAAEKDVKATIQAITEVMPRPVEVQTHAQTVAMAENLFDGMTGEQVVESLRKQNVALADMPQRITAARVYLTSTAQKVATLAKAADAMPNNPIAFHEMKKAMTHLYDVHESAAGMSRSIGRALDAHKIIVGETTAEEASRAAVEQMTLAAQKEALNSMSKSEMLATARLLRMSEGDPNEVLSLMRGQAVLSEAKQKLTGLAKVVDKVNEWRMEAMLSGPRTFFVNAVSNALAAAQMPAEMWWGGVITGNKAMRQQGRDQLVNLFLESGEAWRAARKAFKTGANTLDEAGSVLQDTAVGGNNVLNGVAKVAHLPSRMLMTTDEFFKTLNYRSSVRAQSMRLAREEGVTDAAQLATRLSEDMKAAFNPQGGATNVKALKWARTATFQNPLEYGYGKAWQEVIQQNPELRIITPFVRTPVNLFRYAWQRTPVLGAFQKQMRTDIMAGGERRAMALAKQSMGAAAFTGAGLLAYNKIITGGGPKDPALRKQWLAAGNQPYSVKLPSGGWMSYARANPTFNFLGIVADLTQMSGELPEEKHTEIAAALAASIASNVTNQTFMQGLSDALDAFSHGDEHQMMRLFSNTAGSFVPNVLRQMNPDNTLRETRGMVDELMNRVPGLSTDLEPRRNIFGEPIMKPPGYLNQSLNPFTYMTDPGDSSVQQELLKLGKAMSVPPSMKGDIDLKNRTLYGDGKKKQSPYDRWMELMSKSGARDELTKKVNSDSWQSYSDDRRFEEASKVLSKHQFHTWRQVLSEYPKLDTALNGQQRAKDAAMRSRPSESPQFISQ